jgi:hypothetical protein
MTDYSASRDLYRPNDSVFVSTGGLFYAGKAGLLSYFGIFGTISRQFKDDSETAPPLDQTAIPGLFFQKGPHMAIV